MNRITFVLAFGVFGIITTEFGVIGILPDIAETFKIRIGKVGLLVSLFALVVAISGPFVTVFASRFDRKMVVQFGLIVFLISNILSAFSFSYGILLFARILPAFFLPAFFANGIVLATASVPKDKAIKAVAIIYMGLGIATVIGIPLITLIAGFSSWRISFVFMAAINILALVAVSYVVPKSPSKSISTSVYAIQLKILKKKILWLNIVSVIFISAGAFSVYSYIAEYLKNILEMSSNQISYMLTLFGLSGLLGNWVVGVALSKSIEKTILGYILSIIFIFLVLYILDQSFLFQVILIAVWGFFHMGGFLICQVWISSAATEAPELANSLVVSTANLGIAFGAMIGGSIISNYGIQYIVLGGIATMSFSLITVWLSTKMRPLYSAN